MEEYKIKKIINNINHMLKLGRNSLDLSNYNLYNVDIKQIFNKIEYPNLVTSLNLKGNKIITNGTFEIANTLSNLEALNLSGNKIGDDGLGHITYRLKQMKHLTLSDCDITDKGAKEIANNLKKLEHLNLEHNEIGIEGVRDIFTNLKNLNSIDFSHNTWLKTGIEMSDGKEMAQAIGSYLPASSKTSMTTLKISGYPEGMRNVIIKIVSCLPNIKHLHLSGNNIGDEEVELIVGKLTGLESLDVSNNRITDKGVGDIVSSLPSLKILNLNYNKITDKGVESIVSKMKSLESLKLCGNKISNLSIADSHAFRLSKLKSLDISGYEISYSLAYVIGQYLNLRSLYLSNCEIIDIDWLLNLSALESLDLSNSKTIDYSRVEKLTQRLPNLKYLNISNCIHIDSEILTHLRRKYGEKNLIIKG
ncbi:Leucine Rich Repeat (LRR) protein [Allofrancisella inopinata]|uniref:Leucine rich repeat (LRR) protein n=1 Tax=Allofrancisella inopinata TaxID=1085647 RepID=A0AAE7CRA2_9GAMM|nr:leucine-rich repeat domain-containing protein [Allofrancisella inopinata]QIV96662.1 hypothetical protein E4K63_07400 [Allofrancisella inopinata]TDT66668.1 Leucine Rich Repeat (LRR) protein [Allofrancisella inopinata]